MLCADRSTAVRVRRMNAVRLLLLTALLVGCVHRPQPPNDLIVADSMVVVLTELYLNQAYHTTGRTSGEQPMSRPYAVQRGTLGYRDALARFRLSPDRFARSMEYYTQVPGELDSISKRVVTLLEARQSELMRQPDTLQAPK